MENNATDMTITPAFIDALDSVQAFCFEMNPDIDMAYDYVCEQAGIGSFVHNNEAWDMFYNVWEKIMDDNGVADHVRAGDYRY